MAERQIVDYRASRVGVEMRDGRWWSLGEERDRGEALWSTVKILDRHHSPRHMMDSLYIGLYENSPPYWLGNQAPRSSVTPLGIDVSGTKVTLNVIKSVVDTVAAMIAKNMAELRVVTSGGTWREQQRAKGLTKAVSGCFYETRFHQHQQRAFVDGCLTRKGAVKFWADRNAGKVRCERVPPHTLVWNDLEGDEPRNLYQVVPMSRDTLIAAFPAHAEAIEKAPQSTTPIQPNWRRPSGMASYADMVDVCEGWHLPPSRDIAGRHAMMIEGQVLIDEDWSHEFFPFATYSWDDAYYGFGGRPLAETLVGYQIQLGRKLRVLQAAQDRACVPRWMVEGDTEVTGDHLTNEILGVVRYRGIEPRIVPGVALPPEFYTFIDWLYEKAFAEAGISLLQSQGTKPSGLDSGASLREFNDITATRQVIKAQRLERMTEQAGNIVIALMRDMYAGNKSLVVRAPGTKVIEQIKWRDVDMEEDAFVLRSFAVSALPTHPAGRIAAVVDMIRGGLLPQAEVQGGLGLKLLNFPDTEKVVTLETANQELAQKQVDAALYDGEYLGPEPYQDLVVLRSLAQRQAVHAMTLTGVPEKNLELVRRLAAESDEMLRRAAPAPAPAALPAAPQAALAAPAALPVPAVPSALPA